VISPDLLHKITYLAFNFGQRKDAAVTKPINESLVYGMSAFFDRFKIEKKILSLTFSVPSYNTQVTYLWLKTPRIYLSILERVYRVSGIIKMRRPVIFKRRDNISKDRLIVLCSC